ncbi:MAG TPA: hypothetical protein VLC08_00770 [Chitinolyticbacter sp.]|nr:hypothetical protein [Chitinolyticbacter sp.]
MSTTVQDRPTFNKLNNADKPIAAQCGVGMLQPYWQALTWPLVLRTRGARTVGQKPTVMRKIEKNQIIDKSRRWDDGSERLRT